MKTGKIAFLAVLAVSLLALAFACGDESSDNGEVMGDISDLTEGALAEVEIQILGDGTLYAEEIELGDYEEEEEDDEDEEEDDEFEEEFTAPVEVIADDFSYIIVYADLMVMLDLEDDDDDDDDEDDEDEGELEITDLDVGMWVSVEGLYSETDGIFHADEILAAGEQEREIGSKIQSLTDSSFTMLGLTITYDENTEVEIEEGEDDDEDDDD